MPTFEEIPGWEKRGERPPWEAAEEAARERLRRERSARYFHELAERDGERAQSSVPPPGHS